MAEIQGGDGSATPSNLGLSLQELEDLQDAQQNSSSTSSEGAAGSSTGNEGEATKTPEELAAEKAAADQAAADTAKAAENKEGEEKEGEQAEEDPADTEAFIAEVNKLHGFEDFTVEYPDGVDPLTPEGIHHREKALIEYSQKQFDQYLKDSDPRGYAYLLHRQAGGTDEQWIETKTVSLPEYEAFKNSVDLQKDIISKDLLNRGVDKDIVDATIEKFVKDGKLFEKADTAYKTAEAADKAALAKAEQAATERTQREQAAIKSTVEAITDVVMNSKVSNIVIPDSKRAEFAEHVKQHLFFDGENFFLTKPITKETLAEAIQAEYFGFVKGDLKSLVERRAKTENTNRMRINTQKTKSTSKGSNASGSSSGFVPLGDL